MKVDCQKKCILCLSLCPADLGVLLGFLKQQVRKSRLLLFITMQQLLLISLKIILRRKNAYVLLQPCPVVTALISL